jgi:16S rRNA G966 N2-methylase RsmD
LEKAMLQLSETGILKTGGVLVAEHRKQHKLAESYGKLQKFRDSSYGETVLSFYGITHPPSPFLSKSGGARR